jgi:hypothetical protein
MTELERRYTRLLRLYPTGYRQARGAEMLAVLMDSAPPDRRRPQWREVRGLILGALRVRAGANDRRTAGQSWRVALRAAALMLLIQYAGNALWPLMYNPDDAGVPIAQVAVSIAIATACVLAIVAVFRGAYLAAAVVSAGAFVLETIGPQIVAHFATLPYSTFGLSSGGLPLVVVLLIPLIGRGPVVVPRKLNLLLLVPVVSVALNAYGTLTQDPDFQTGSRAVWQTFAVAAILWSVVDERVAMTFGLAFFSVVVDRAMPDLVLGGWSTWRWPLTDWSMWRWTLADMAILAILPVLDIAIGATVAVRRARI